MGRPAIGQNRHVVVGDDWDELGDLLGGGRSQVVRQLIAWYLRPDTEQLPVRPRARAASSSPSTAARPERAEP